MSSPTYKHNINTGVISFFFFFDIEINGYHKVDYLQTIGDYSAPYKKTDTKKLVKFIVL